MTTLKVDNLSCVRGEVPIFENVSFLVQPGQALQIFGANGTGKSTILQVLAGLIPKFSGSMQWGDSSDGSNGGDDGEMIPPSAIIFQGHDTALKPLLTVRENLGFWARAYGRVDDATLESCVEQVGLSAMLDRPIRHLSAGQKRRAGLARCVLAGRPLWLLDEPNAALDVAGDALVADILTRHLSRGGITIIATHDEITIPSLRMDLSPAIATGSDEAVV